MVLTSSLGLDAEVTCTGSHAVTAADIDNLERISSASVTAVDEYMTEVEAQATVNVGLDQVRSRGSSEKASSADGADVLCLSCA